MVDLGPWDSLAWRVSNLSFDRAGFATMEGLHVAGSQALVRSPRTFAQSRVYK